MPLVHFWRYRKCLATSRSRFDHIAGVLPSEFERALADRDVFTIYLATISLLPHQCPPAVIVNKLFLTDLPSLINSEINQIKNNKG
jgi:hypothetical protein